MKKSLRIHLPVVARNSNRKAPDKNFVAPTAKIGPKFVPSIPTLPKDLKTSMQSASVAPRVAPSASGGSCIVKPPAPYLLSPAAMTFSATFGADNPPVQFISIAGKGASLVPWVASKKQSWLHLETTSGTPPSMVQVSVVIAGLQAGTYSDTISIAATDTTDTPLTIPVTLTLLTPTAKPVFSVVPGTYTTAQSVRISDATPGEAIYYTINNSTPTTSSALYSGAISVSSTETIRAIAIAPGYGRSAIADATYTIKPYAAAPTFSPVAGTYTSAQSVKLADSTTSATIYYTTDGTTPTNASTRYVGAISVKRTETIKAIAYAGGYTPSPVASAVYTIHLPAATPTFTPVGETYTKAQSVTIADTTTGATIYYTLDGTTPTNASTRYLGPISVKSTETIKAVAYASDYSASAVASATYTIP
jgi:hypothetical protein